MTRAWERRTDNAIPTGQGCQKKTSKLERIAPIRKKTSTILKWQFSVCSAVQTCHKQHLPRNWVGRSIIRLRRFEEKKLQRDGSHHRDWWNKKNQQINRILLFNGTNAMYLLVGIREKNLSHCGFFFIIELIVDMIDDRWCSMFSKCGYSCAVNLRATGIATKLKAKCEMWEKPKHPWRKWH